MVNGLLTALATTAIMAGPANAQSRGQATPNTSRRAVPVSQPNITGRAVPRQVQQVPNWQQFQRGVDTRSRGFSVSLFYSNGVPFYNNIPGYIYSNMWFPGWCGPQPMWRSDIEYLQWSNVSRFGPTVGQARAIRNGIPPYAPAWVAAEAERTQPATPVVDTEKEEMRRQLRETELENAKLRGEREGYERGLIEGRSQTPQIPSQPKEESKFTVNTQYDKVDRVQYAGEAKSFYNDGLFEGIRKVTDGNVDLVALIESDYRIGIRDANSGMTNLVDIDLSKYDNCLEPDALSIKFMSEIINRINIDAAKVNAAMYHVELTKRSSYTPSACRGR